MQPPLVWMDLEMTGLEPDQDVILEIATLITDADLHVLAKGPELVVHQSDAVLAAMNPWCIEHHGASGLTARVRSSQVSQTEAEAKTLAFLQDYFSVQGITDAPPLCGNSIHQDRRFLFCHMPKLEAFFHYRNLDVSTVKELVRRWYPKVEIPIKKESHRALDDIHESIAELRYYRQHVFLP
ncbi:MAG: oligoribonuclease [Mariprofundaceae bacterium]|nr:oligoribonuclease [Mariprofundaceae bacterium]